VVKAAVIAHPSFLINEDAAQIKKPILFLCAENDNYFGPDIRGHFEKVLTSTGLGTFIDFPGVNHGFVSRPDGSEQANQQRDKAVQDAIQFFKKNI
jgi:dienelactone hydrolase